MEKGKLEILLTDVKRGGANRRSFLQFLKGEGQTRDFAYRFQKGRGKPEIFLTVFKRGGANRRFFLQILKGEGQTGDLMT